MEDVITLGKLIGLGLENSQKIQGMSSLARPVISSICLEFLCTPAL